MTTLEVYYLIGLVGCAVPVGTILGEFLGRLTHGDRSPSLPTPWYALTFLAGIIGLVFMNLAITRDADTQTALDAERTITTPTQTQGERP